MKAERLLWGLVAVGVLLAGCGKLVPEELKNLSGQAVLKCAKISLIDLRTGETVDSVRIDRIDYDEVNDE